MFRLHIKFLQDSSALLWSAKISMAENSNDIEKKHSNFFNSLKWLGLLPSREIDEVLLSNGRTRIEQIWSNVFEIKISYKVVWRCLYCFDDAESQCIPVK